MCSHQSFSDVLLPFSTHRRHQPTFIMFLSKIYPWDMAIWLVTETHLTHIKLMDWFSLLPPKHLIHWRTFMAQQTPKPGHSPDTSLTTCWLRCQMRQKILLILFLHYYIVVEHLKTAFSRWKRSSLTLTIIIIQFLKGLFTNLFLSFESYILYSKIKDLPWWSLKSEQSCASVDQASAHYKQKFNQREGTHWNPSYS